MPRHLLKKATVRWLPTALLTVVLATASACGAGPSPTSSTSPAAAPASIESLTARSKNEKDLVIYGNAPAALFRPLVEAFKSRSPWINVHYTAFSDNVVFSKFQSERAQSARTADLLIASAPALWVQAADNGLTAKVTPQGLSNFPSYPNQGRGIYVMSPEPVIMAYNTKLLSGSAIPTSYANMATNVKADPAKYKLATATIDNALNYGFIYGLIHILGWNETWSMYDALAANSKTFESLDLLTQIATGAASAGYGISGLGQTAISALTKGVASWGFMQDATPLVPRGIAMTEGATSPASAQLFLDFIFSDPGQQVLCTAGFEAAENDFAPANGCTANLTDLQKKVPAKSIYLVPISKDVLDQRVAITARWNQAFHR